MSTPAPPPGDDTPTARLEQHAGVDVVVATGDLDIYSVMAFRDVVAMAVLSLRPYVLVDLTAVGFLDSTGIAALVSSRRRLQAREAELGLVAGRGAALQVLKMVGLDQVLRIWPTLDDALAEVGVA
ncbi:STAS domain-containing protein [Nocardioides anomalus]|uniref:Anti-sigma factor antagonist n=1 Tax=Nocardioides anomalus TaxID=2712223 RepID=A0A6G6WFH0_9ACTN|nr:STAS domain-containing protein [Nocardioides anomalus]QIG43845.1 STAS domain-containing protein [Nocardioides anomalus]